MITYNNGKARKGVAAKMENSMPSPNRLKHTMAMDSDATRPTIGMMNRFPESPKAWP